MNLVASVHPSVCALMVEPFDLRPSSFAWRSTLTLARVSMLVKVVGQRSNAKNNIFAWLLPCFEVKVKGQGQMSGVQRSILGARLCQVQQRAIRVITSLRSLSVCL